MSRISFEGEKSASYVILKYKSRQLLGTIFRYILSISE